MNKKITYIFEILKKLYPDPKTELDYSTPFQLMVAVILSAQTTDKQVNKITPAIFKCVEAPKDLSKCYATEKAFESAVSGVNYYKTKAKNIRKLAKILSTPKPPLRGLQISHRSGPPSFNKEGTIEELMKLPGIGIKSAKVIVHVLWDLPVIAVDTHVHRVANRWGIIPGRGSRVAERGTPEQTSEILEKLVPLKYKNIAHHAMVLFGRYVCTAKKPKCEMCKLQKYCDYFKSSILKDIQLSWTVASSFAKGGQKGF